MKICNARVAIAGVASLPAINRLPAAHADVFGVARRNRLANISNTIRVADPNCPSGSCHPDRAFPSRHPRNRFSITTMVLAAWYRLAPKGNVGRQLVWTGVVQLQFSVQK